MEVATAQKAVDHSPAVAIVRTACPDFAPGMIPLYPAIRTPLMIYWQSYMFYQLKSFDESLSDSVIATQAGLLASSFTGAQFLTAMMWGRISDSERGGRKLVLIIGLFGTSESRYTSHIGILQTNTGMQCCLVSDLDFPRPFGKPWSFEPWEEP